MLIPSFEHFQRALDKVEKVLDKDLSVCNLALCECATKIRLHIRRENQGFPIIVLAPLLALVVEELIQRSSSEWKRS